MGKLQIKQICMNAKEKMLKELTVARTRACYYSEVVAPACEDINELLMRITNKASYLHTCIIFVLTLR